MIVMVRRRPDLAPEVFRDGYENVHSRMAVRLFGHLWSEYRRNYLLTGRQFGIGGLVTADAVGFDAISEFVFKDESALVEMGRIGLANQEEIHADEARWFDRTHCFVMACDTVEEDLGQGA